MEIRAIASGERAAAIELVWDTFLQFEAPDYPEQGVESFRVFITDDGIFGAVEFFGAFEGGELRGVIAMRERRRHICLFFVPGEHQRRGVGRALWEHVLAISDAAAITVNSSPFAVPVYRKFGFKAVGAEQMTDGIIYTPMRRSI